MGTRDVKNNMNSRQINVLWYNTQKKKNDKNRTQDSKTYHNSQESERQARKVCDWKETAQEDAMIFPHNDKNTQ